MQTRNIVKFMKIICVNNIFLINGHNSIFDFYFDTEKSALVCTRRAPQDWTLNNSNSDM